MAATAISLYLRTKHRRRPITNPSFLHFFSSSTPSSDSTNSVDDQNTPSPPPPPPPQSQSSFSSYFSETPSKAAFAEELRENDSHPYADLRRGLREALHKLEEERTKKQMSQRLDVLGHPGGTPNLLLSPPKEHLVEKYFHPDHMSSSEKMKLELQKVRDEFKMSESDLLVFKILNDKPINPRRKGKKTKEKDVEASRKSWTQKEEQALLNALKEMVTKGENFSKDSFKSGYLNRLEGMLLAALPGTYIRANPHIASKIKVWKKNYHSVKDMRNTSGFVWNGSAKMIKVESNTVWEDYCKRDSNAEGLRFLRDNSAKGLRFKSFPYYEDWSLIFGNDRATGDMAESAADVFEVLGVEDVDGDEVHEGSTTVSKNDKFPPEPPKKKAQVSETLMTGLFDLGDKLIGSLEFFACKFDMLGSRMGYQHDLSAKRGAVNEALKNLPITVEQRVTAGMAITEDAQKVDYFFSLTSDEEKMIMVKKLCKF
ncbi:hypothetical protein Vadar_022466 [Vaccinium darrowii]|uniref:Uncharacterized protein n=1 Tax=Vaccinium darrowii TaxID=229202 RepID=A0ACB7YF67_9ERIC|nr:hypothetical protein Vadar_022466 [Vaccinium darrowii]